MEVKKNILVCPLDWGLGHASRCVPIINELQGLGHTVTIGADKNPLAFLQLEFPSIKCIRIPGYKVNYDEKGSFLKLLIPYCSTRKLTNDPDKLSAKCLDV